MMTITQINYIIDNCILYITILVIFVRLVLPVQVLDQTGPGPDLWTGSAEVQGQGHTAGGPDLEVQVQVWQNCLGPGPDQTLDSLIRLLPLPFLPALLMGCLNRRTPYPTMSTVCPSHLVAVDELLFFDVNQFHRSWAPALVDHNLAPFSSQGS